MLADKNGRFSLEDIDLGLESTITVGAEKYTDMNQPIHDYTQNMVVYLYSNNGFRQPMGGAGGGIDEVVEMEEDMPMRDIEAFDDMDFALAPVEVQAAPRRERARAKGKGAMKKAKAPMRARAAGPRDQGKLGLAKNDARIADIATKAEAMPGIEPQEHRKDEKQKNKEQGILAADDASGTEEAEKAFAGQAVDNRFNAIVLADKMAIEAQQQGAKYYRAREFAAPVYADQQGEAPHAAKRTDFRENNLLEPRSEG